jgi:hypothetical protein
LNGYDPQPPGRFRLMHRFEAKPPRWAALLSLYAVKLSPYGCIHSFQAKIANEVRNTRSSTRSSCSGSSCHCAP